MQKNVIRGVDGVFPGESNVVEFKAIVVDDIKKGIIAFANTDGGTLYVGVSDDGSVSGLCDVESDLMSINNMIRDGIKPDVTLFTQSRIEQMNGKSIICIYVQRGTDRPYYLTGKGIRPEGVFVRYGAASVPATDTAIRKMIRDTDGESYEKLRSQDQSLTFNAATVEFAKRKIAFGPSQMATLRLTNADGIYSNLSLLVSDQCSHTIKVATFQDSTQQVFLDRKEFGGSLFWQIDDVYNYLDRANRIKSTFDKLLRIDRRDYPDVALREALINAVVHREYATSSSILIKVFADRMEFISPGGLISDLEVEDIMSGYSACRNTELAAIFYRLQLIEAYGTGIMKIMEAYKSSPRQPKIEITPNVFKMVLPNLNATYSEGDAEEPEGNVLQYAQENGSISRKQTEHLLGISQTAAGVMLRSLVNNGMLIREGNSRNTRYYIQRR